MTIQELTTQVKTRSKKTIPPLNPGDKLTRVEFHLRYQAHPEIKKAELIEGVVYMPSPLRFEQHSHPHAAFMGWIFNYSAFTPGVRAGDNATVFLDYETEVQPDVLLRIDENLGGKSRINAQDYIEGAPELIVEIAASSVSYDLHAKKNTYARHGVQEYIAAPIYNEQIFWFVLGEGGYEPLQPDGDGILRSRAFPGLWLNPAAFWAGDLAGMLATLQQGLASPEHGVFVERLKTVGKV